jgi:hypothetical protein
VTVIADSKKRVVVSVAQPGDRFDVQLADGKIVLTKLGPMKPRITYHRKNGLLLASSERTISWEEARRLLDEFP